MLLGNNDSSAESALVLLDDKPKDSLVREPGSTGVRGDT